MIGTRCILAGYIAISAASGLVACREQGSSTDLPYASDLVNILQHSRSPLPAKIAFRDAEIKAICVMDETDTIDGLRGILSSAGIHTSNSNTLSGRRPRDGYMGFYVVSDREYAMMLPRGAGNITFEDAKCYSGEAEFIFTGDAWSLLGATVGGRNG